MLYDPYLYEIHESTRQVVKAFKATNDLGEEIVWTHPQLLIIQCILERRSPEGDNRVQVESLTQYGKSASIGFGVMCRSALKCEPFALVAGTKEKARIIMEYVVKYSIENPPIAKLLELPEGLERLRQRRSQDRLTYSGGGEVRVFSADARNKQAQGDALMGFGAPNLIEDESALVDDITHAKAVRMVGGTKNNFLMKVGNPFKRNHFYKSHLNPKYFKIVIDYNTALKEGRITQEFIDEMRQQPLFDILYEVKFPEEELMDTKGWMPLLTDRQVENAMIKGGQPFGNLRLGNDVAGGGRNFSVIVLRGYNLARKLFKENLRDTMQFGGHIRTFQQQLAVKANDIFIDATGVGKGLYDRFREMEVDPKYGSVNGIYGAGEPLNKEMFANKRAENYWLAREWIIRGGQLEEDSDWMQLARIKYKVNSSGKIIIMSKEEMLKNGIDSPDIADAFSLTFAKPEQPASKMSRRVETEVSESEDDPYEIAKLLP